jgi:hypothetical protein
MAVLVLRAEHDNFSVCIDLYIVSWRPVKQIIRIDCLLHPVRVGRSDLSVQDVAPMGALAQIAFKSLEQRGCIDSRRETEVLAADFA